MSRNGESSIHIGQRACLLSASLDWDSSHDQINMNIYFTFIDHFYRSLLHHTIFEHFILFSVLFSLRFVFHFEISSGRTQCGVKNGSV